MRIILFFILTLSIQSHAKIEVLFHPHDPTLEKIAQWIESAEETVDIAMYNMDASNQSPIIKMLKSPQVQSRIWNQKLKIRLIYEGYASKADNAKRMEELENLGIDVRYLGRSVKMHHKLAVIDARLPHAKVITGSANWSMSSYRNYNENIVFMSYEPEATYRYNLEFSRLWKLAKEHGFSSVPYVIEVPKVDEEGMEVFFNTTKRLKLTSDEPGSLTSQVVRLMDGAKDKVEVATTRIRLLPILEAVKRASLRGVKVKIVISQDDFRDIQKRAEWLLGDPNIELRIKFYSLRIGDYMFFQMHNKFMIVDDKTILTGSFNWSQSSERNHIENILELSGEKALDVEESFNTEFDYIWNMNRENLENIRAKMAQAKAEGRLPKCSFSPTVVTVEEIADLLRNFRKCE